ncbi:MAG: NUDIX hydrolase [Gammaproteobacteria bacterium]|nr:NUDIX hydrolase [Gammaproteobacteria bacterium]
MEKAPFLTVDSVIFSFDESALKLLLVKRAIDPFNDQWSLPGGMVAGAKGNTLEAIARDKLMIKSGVDVDYIEQVFTTGNDQRDPRGWSVSVVYSALIPYQAAHHNADWVADAAWFKVDELASMRLAFDHQDIIQVALERLRQKSLYSIVAGYALPAPFTLSQLQHIHEVILGKPIQAKSFRRRIEQADLLEPAGEIQLDRGRPAALFRMKPAARKYTFVRNLDG